MKLLLKNISVNCNRDAEAEEGKQNFKNVKKSTRDSVQLFVMDRENCWVWFKGSLKGGGSWKGGFTYKKDENPGVLIQNPAYVQCRVPDWRISTTEPLDKCKGPEIPENPAWKIL